MFNIGRAFTAFEGPSFKSQFICSFNKCILSTSRAQASRRHQKCKAGRQTRLSFKDPWSPGEVRRKQSHSWVYKTLLKVSWQQNEEALGIKREQHQICFCSVDAAGIIKVQVTENWASREDTFWDLKVIVECHTLSRHQQLNLGRKCHVGAPGIYT